MINPQTWVWVFGIDVQVSGFLLGLFGVLIVFSLNFLWDKLVSQVEDEESEKLFSELRKGCLTILIPLGILLISSIILLASGNILDYSEFVFWFFGVCFPVIVFCFELIVIVELLIAFASSPSREKKSSS